MQAILKYYNIEASQDKIYKIGHSSEKELKSLERGGGKKQEHEGLGHRGILAIAEHYKLESFVKRNADIDCLKYFLRKDIPVLVNWWPRIYDDSSENDDTNSGDEDIKRHHEDRGHYSVMFGFEEKVPKEWNGNKKKIERFVKIADSSNDAPDTTYWLDYNNVFLDSWYDKTRNKRHDRWIAAFFNEIDETPPFSGSLHYIR